MTFDFSVIAFPSGKFQRFQRHFILNCIIVHKGKCPLFQTKVGLKHNYDALSPLKADNISNKQAERRDCSYMTEGEAGMKNGFGN